MVPPSLVDLAITTVYNNLDSYDEDLLKTCIGPVRQIRQKMLEEVHRKANKNQFSNCSHRDEIEKNHNDKIWAILPCLMKSKFRTKIDISVLTFTPFTGCDYCIWPNSRFQEFISCLGANTPNLKKLFIHGPFKFEYSLEECEVASIIQLKNLTVLQIFRVRVPLSGILDISRRCEKLERITANTVANDEVPSTSAVIRDDFVDVRVDATILQRGFISLYMVSGNPIFSTDKDSFHLEHEPRYIREFSLAQLFAQKLRSMSLICTSLEDIEEMVEFPHLPVIKYARIECGGKSAHALRCFLKRNGENLQKLFLSGIHSKENMTLGEIFSFCPNNLQFLGLYDCNLSGNDAPVEAIQQLRRFEWRNYEKRCSHDVVAFSSILSAPLLKEVRIWLPKINLSDNATVIARIQRREILRNLKRFSMSIRIELTSDNEGDNSSYLKSIKELKNAIRSLNNSHRSIFVL